MRFSGPCRARVVGRWLIAVFGTLATMWLAGRGVAAIVFEVRCGGHLKRAADANTVPIAARELEVAVGYLEANGMTEGYTSVLYRGPDEDVGFLHQNLSAALAELRALPEGASPLERTNVLMKLRETLCDVGKDGVDVTAPMGISVFPHNALWAWSGAVAWLLFGAGLASWLVGASRDGIL